MRFLQRPFPRIDALSHLPPVLARVYAARGVAAAHEVDHGLERLLPPEGLAGMPSAVALLTAALEAGQRIVVVADFDADGATSCAVAIRALRAFGASDVRYLVPNRFEFGYGLTPEIVAVAAQHAPDLLITVDNGISSIEGVAAARARGMRVLVTDHHLPGEVLPDADSIVNPNQPGDQFPSKQLAGVGVIFYVMLALRAHLRASGWFARRGLPEPNLAQLLDLVALGTVADVVPLDANNRIVVAQGLARINKNQCCAGIRALLAVAGRRPGRLTATDLAFCVAPRLNAAGRLEDMSLGIAGLLTGDANAASDIARQLDQLNRERRAIETEMQEQAEATLAVLQLEDAVLPRGVCLFHEEWHQGVIGILAGRLKDRLHRPVIAFAPANETELKGSARSVPGVHIRDVLDTIAARHPGLLQKFGGHALAAGLNLTRNNLADFAAVFNSEVSRLLDEDAIQGTILTDGELAPADFRVETADLLRAGGPWGQAFPEPLFDGHFTVLDQRRIGERHVRLRLGLPGGGVDGIVFNHEGPAFVCGSTIRAAYRLDVNEYGGLRSLQLVIQYVGMVSSAHVPSARASV